jgi:hypothetical protein
MAADVVSQPAVSRVTSWPIRAALLMIRRSATSNNQSINGCSPEPWRRCWTMFRIAVIS